MQKNCTYLIFVFSFEIKQDFDFKSMDSNDPRVKKQRVVVTNIHFLSGLKKTKHGSVDEPLSCLSAKSDKEPRKNEKQNSNDPEAKQQRAVVSKIKYVECLKTTIDDAVDRPASCLSDYSEEEEQDKKEEINLELKDHPANTRLKSEKVISKKVPRDCLALKPFNKGGKKWFEGITRTTRHRNQNKR